MVQFNDVFSGILCGIVVVFTMKFVPIFHGFDSNDVRRVLFEDVDGKKYMLVPSKTDCE